MLRNEWLALVPRVTILVRDGRHFDAGADATAEPIFPGPNTVAGAVFAAYGAEEPEPDAICGPMLARRVDDSWSSIFLVPGDLVHSDEGMQFVRRLQPSALSAITDLADECPQWLVGDGDQVAGWVSGPTLSSYLKGELFGDGDELPTDEVAVRFGSVEDGGWLPVARERRIGLARTEDRVARDRYLYQATHLRPVDGVALLAECQLPDEWERPARGPVQLGGRGRLADVEAAPAACWPDRPTAFPDGRVLVYVATPAIWPGGWRIPVPAHAGLVAAAVGPPEPVATASPRLGMTETRALRWAVPPGSVYLISFEGSDGPGAAKRWAEAVHGTAYGLDGRARPVNGTAGRMRATRLFQERPEASVRAIAAEAGISPSTALDVRNRLRDSEDPLRSHGRRAVPAAGSTAVDGCGAPGESEGPPGALLSFDTARVLHSLRADPSLRFTDSGRAVQRWLYSHLASLSEGAGTWATPSRPAVAELARRIGDSWYRLAEYVDSVSWSRDGRVVIRRRHRGPSSGTRGGGTCSLILACPTTPSWSTRPCCRSPRGGSATCPSIWGWRSGPCVGRSISWPTCAWWTSRTTAGTRGWPIPLAASPPCCARRRSPCATS